MRCVWGESHQSVGAEVVVYGEVGVWQLVGVHLHVLHDGVVHGMCLQRLRGVSWCRRRAGMCLVMVRLPGLGMVVAVLVLG